jgi:hypothetical protein
MSAIGAAPNQWGVTAPISTALPTDADKKSSDALIEALRRENNFESTEDTNKRYVYHLAPSTLILTQPVALSMQLSLIHLRCADLLLPEKESSTAYKESPKNSSSKPSDLKANPKLSPVPQGLKFSHMEVIDLVFLGLALILIPSLLYLAGSRETSILLYFLTS